MTPDTTQLRAFAENDTSAPFSDEIIALCNAYEAEKRRADDMAKPEAEAQSHHEADGCPTEGAVLKREWRSLTAKLTAARKPWEQLKTMYPNSPHIIHMADEALATLSEP